MQRDLTTLFVGLWLLSSGLAVANERALRFPEGAGVGVLYSRPSTDGSWYDGWKEVAEAKGLVQVEEGHDVRLEVSKRASSDLRFLRDLGAGDLQVIVLMGSDVTDDQMKHMQHLRELRFVDLGKCGITDESLETVGQIRRLLHLNLFGTEVTNKGLRHLQNLKKLESLNLSSTKVTEEGLEHLEPLESLTRLSLWSVEISDGAVHLTKVQAISDVGAAHVAKLQSLEEIDANLDLTDAGVELLSRLPNLKSLRLSGHGITDAGCEHIAKMHSLSTLWLQGCGVSDTGLAKLGGLQQLNMLLISNTRISGDGLIILRKLPQLRELYINFGGRDGTFWSDSAHLRHVGESTSLVGLEVYGERLISGDLHDLKNLLNLERLTVGHGVCADDRAAIVIAGLTSLKSLSISDGVMTNEGLLQLTNLKQLRALQIHGHFTDAGLLALKRLQSLRSVSISSPYLEEQSKDRLAAAIPSLLRNANVSLTRLQKLPISLSETDDIRRKGLASERLEKNALEGKPAPPFHLTGWINAPEGGLVNESLRGKVVLVDFWGTWCGPCVAAHPKLRRLHEKYSNQGLVILGIHSTAGSEEMADFVKDRQLPWPVAVDVEKQTVKSWHVRSYPEYYLIDRAGVLRVAGVWSDDLERAVAMLLCESSE